MGEKVIKIGVIGGSGLYSMPELGDIEKRKIATPYGQPSGDVVIGTLRGKRVAFIARHGEGHVHTPASIPQRANIYALKSLGVRFILAVNACGSLREAYAPGHIVVPDQLIDYCIGGRVRTFFDEGIVAHISVAEPLDTYVRSVLVEAIKRTAGTVHDGGTFLIEDGPRFATRAESHLFRQWGCDIIGMTTIPEAFLAREAEIAYATMAHITDYDSWHEEEEAVNVSMVMETFRHNIALAQEALANAVEILDVERETPSHRALDGAIMTAKHHMDADKLASLRLLVGRALGLDG